MRALLLLFLLGQELDETVFSIEGVVVDAKGKARAGAVVQLWDELSEERFLGQARSDAAGRFSVAVTLAAVARREHPFGPVLIVVSGPGLARVRQTSF